MAESTQMTDKLSKSLDEIIAENKKERVDKRKNFKSNRQGNADRKINEGGDNNRDRPWKKNNNFNNNNNNRNRNFNRNNNRDNNRNEGGFDRRRNDSPQQFRSNQGQRRRGTLVYVDNLHHDIVNSEIRELFEKIGTLRRCGIKWDSLGRSTGSAVVEFENTEDARKAVNEYNGAVLDGQTLEVRLADQREGPSVQKNIRKGSFGGRRVVSKYKD
mmetsp:Transcript_14347/g.15816  ORF Transcript_14347/g.15816 Transcript_14347/m.15816 type:complete len:215 (+) Transcript_14347:72-716(+)